MLVTLLTMVIVTTLMIGFNALYVAGEFATVSARKSRLIQAANSGNRLAKLMVPIVEDHHKLDNYIAASQVGITLSSIVLGIYGQQQIAPLIAPLFQQLPLIDNEVAAAGIASFLVLIFLTGLQVILGELVPKSIAIQYPERVAMITAIPMRWSADFILRPFIILLNGSGSLILRLIGANHAGGHGHVHSPEEIHYLIQQSHEGGLLDAEERELLDNALRIGELTVGEIVVPRPRIIAASLDTPLPELLRLAATSDYTRIPIYEGDIDHLVGFVHLKDLFRFYHTGKEANVKSLLRQASFVPETMPLNDVWEVLNREQNYLAVVFDEYGGTMGMVTREDLIEELFGELQDEFDEDEIPPILQIDARSYQVRGDVAIVTLNGNVGLSLPTENAHTVGGLMLDILGRIPEVGEKITLEGVQIKVLSIQNKMIDQVMVTLPQRKELRGEAQ